MNYIINLITLMLTLIMYGMEFIFRIVRFMLTLITFEIPLMWKLKMYNGWKKFKQVINFYG